MPVLLELILDNSFWVPITCWFGDQSRAAVARMYAHAHRDTHRALPAGHIGEDKTHGKNEEEAVEIDGHLDKEVASGQDQQNIQELLEVGRDFCREEGIARSLGMVRL